ncbi:ABC transporter ATP-binding protein [Brachyspira pilosicoli]|uniref:ATP-binding cassette domain-containing protein n=1 Tax=Brachyspira pilosicoli TaxID=52584 RepID=A0AAJ6KDX9_BRAPL|nr:ATP-binding cassette domain-containing protein [Brachyspira pilosicoli]WIH91006.1 ATP-binding cassette domain-containing protein [Brachyspira pilosicoli]WIH93297.1 ATP-binding cassette domain-containing protein [Brachyspira pilosicoli]WIH95587.1 ATP-binding cassette domain-containing protein [Brachyspira pilosicoli]
MIKVDNVVKYYGEHLALKGVSYTINKGEIVGFLGPNGAGKSTMMRIITGYLPATSGYVYLDDYEVYDNPIELKKRIGYMPENVSLYTEMTVTDYLKFCAKLKGVPSKKVKSAVENTIEITGLTKYKDRIIGHLSKGYRQRTGIAQAIIHDPEVLILDEPTSGLDPNQLIEVRALIKSLGGTRTVILSTHILSEVEDTCERALIIDSGELIAEDTIEGLKMAMDREILGGNIELKVADRQNDALLCVREVHGVVQAETDNFGTIIIECERGNDSRAEIVKHLVNNNFDVLEIKPKERSLEEVFIYFTDKKKNQDFDKSKYIKDDSIKNNTEEE